MAEKSDGKSTDTESDAPEGTKKKNKASMSGDDQKVSDGSKKKTPPGDSKAASTKLPVDSKTNFSQLGGDPKAASTEPSGDPKATSTKPIGDCSAASTKPPTNPKAASTTPPGNPKMTSTKPPGDYQVGSLKPPAKPKAASTLPPVNPKVASIKAPDDSKATSTKLPSDYSTASTKPPSNPKAASTTPPSNPKAASTKPPGGHKINVAKPPGEQKTTLQLTVDGGRVSSRLQGGTKLQEKEKEKRSELVKLHALMIPDLWKIDITKAKIGIITQRNWEEILPSVSLSRIDESTVAVEVHLHMSKREMTGKFEFKFCVEERKKKQYEYFGDQYHVHCNRLLDPNLSYIYKNKESCYHHYVGYIVPSPPGSTSWWPFWDNKVVKFLAKAFGPGTSETDALRCQSLLHYLEDYSVAPQSPNCIDFLCQPSIAHVIDHICAIFSQMKDIQLCQHYSTVSSCDKVSQEFYKWIRKFVSTLSKTPQEVPELAAKMKFAGCVLVTIMHKVDVFKLLENDTREDLMVMLKYSGQREQLVGCYDHMQQLLASAKTEKDQLFTSVKAFWMHVADKDRMHFDVLPVIFQLKGCFQPGQQLKESVYSILGVSKLKPIAKKSDLKKSVEECLVLVELSFCPVLAQVILPLVPLSTWLEYEVLGKFPIGIVLDQLHEYIANVHHLNSNDKTRVIINVGKCLLQLVKCTDSSSEAVFSDVKPAMKVAIALLAVSWVELDMKSAAVQLCLWLCTCKMKKDSTFTVEEILLNICKAVVKGIQAQAKNLRHIPERDKRMSMFGCSVFECEEKEIKIWGKLLALDCKEAIKGKWTDACATVVVKRFKELGNMQEQFQILERESHVPEVLEKLLLDCLLESFTKLDDKAKRNYVSIGSQRIQRLLSKYLSRKYPSPESITFIDLCSWSLWPHCIKVLSKSQYDKGAYECVRAMAMVESIIDTIMKKDVSVENVRMISLHLQNFKDVVKSLYEVRGGIHQPTDVMEMVGTCERAIKVWEENIKELKFLARESPRFMVGKGKDECEELRRFCEKDVEQLTIVDLEKHLDNYPVAVLVLPACHKFYILFKASQSDITAKLRSDFLREVDSYESFAKDAWPRFYDRLKEKVDNMRQLRIPCEEAAKLLLGTSAKRSPELKKLVMALNQCEGSPKEGHEWVKRILDHTVVYSDAKRTSQTAQLLLEVKDSLQLIGDFDRAKNIARIEEKYGPTSLADVQIGTLSSDAKFLAYFKDLYSPLIEIGRSQILVEWMRTLGDASQLQTFTNIALITQCEDASSVDRLTSLEAVATKLAPVIFQLPKTAGMTEFMDQCYCIRKETLEDVSGQIIFCNKNVEWYQRIQATLGSVEETAYGQLTDLTEAGKYTIAVPKGTIPRDIKDLVQVEIVERATAKSKYSLEDLKDLQSKIALIKGKISKRDFTEKTETFWQGLELTVRIASCLLELIHVGHMQYRTYNCKFSLEAPDIIDDLKKRAKTMESDLEEWSKNVESLRSKYYHLNYFTARQLSIICQELSTYHGRESSIDPWFLNLLECLSPSIQTEPVISAIEDIIAEREERKQKSLLGLTNTNDKLPSCKQEGTGDADAEDISDFALLEGVEPGQTIVSNDILNVEDLTEEQQQLYDELLELEFVDEHILAGLVECGNDFDAIEAYCLKRSSENVEERAVQLSRSQEEKNVSSNQTREPDSAELPIDENHPNVVDLINAGFEPQLAIEAVKICSDEEKALDYCLEKEKDMEVRGVPQLTSSDDVNKASFILPFTVDVPEEELWSLEDVGRFLQLVASKHEEKVLEYFPVEREFKFFPKGSPNVIVVPRRELFQNILAVYMHSRDLPLPTAEEVLYCYSKTTAEEIQLLWRRAVGDPENKRIFCLVCEYNLSYKVAKEAVQDLREITQGHKDFKMVIICCKEDESSSLLLGDLRDYKRSLPPKPTRKEIMEYIRSHFINDVVKFGPDLSEVGASADPDNLCARVVTSNSAGMGKSLYIRRLVEKFKDQHDCLHQVVTLHGPDVNNDMVVKVLHDVTETPDKPVVYHLDVSERIVDDIGSVLFRMLILRALQDSEGSIWRCKLKNLHVVEITVPLSIKESEVKADNVTSNSVDLLQLLPMAKCLSPKECLTENSAQNGELLIGMDEKKLLEESYQRVYQYLTRFGQGSVDKFVFNPSATEGTAEDWIKLITRFFNMESDDPSWVELYRFSSFLDIQLKACENSIYVTSGEDGFKSFVIKFMINMSVDFTVPSLKAAYDDHTGDVVSNAPDLEGYQIIRRRQWETSVHPYIFFNRDRAMTGKVHYDSMTFIGFNLQQVGKTVNLLSLNDVTIENGIMVVELYRWLKGSEVEMRQNPHTWKKPDILKKLFRVFGSNLKADPEPSYYTEVDPDPTYALTYDNLVKMLAIQMRFRCDIPVVIMGETGCGKTRLIRYMCQLQAKFRTDLKDMPRQTFFILKVHGGITESDIVKFVETVQEEARANKTQGFDTVLFFDEANTTDAIGLIKEIMCDKRMRGKPIKEDIKFIAACNPYRKHSESMIEKLESAGLGFFIKINETKQKLGATPLRHLVYRVLELPASMKPLVYDYGSLNTDTEKTYIRRIAENHVSKNRQLQGIEGLTDAVMNVLSWSQDYMRKRKDECSYVSLRDVERCMIVFEWFHCLHKDIYKEMVRVGGMEEDSLTDPATMAMIMSVAVCYGSRLIERGDFETKVSAQFTTPFLLPEGVETYSVMLKSCQEAFLSNMELGPNIAHNAALRENVFMMAVCVELRIPLFVVGKPGSSKSLAKSIVAESMKQRKTDFLGNNFKSVKLISYQCSQLSTPESIIDVFKSAQNIQKNLGYKSNIALVVLDEVGLAEDSPSLPLKVLHPLLEDGTDGSDPRELQVVEREERVAFIGISNWALDPAKMNRGIMVRRGAPDVQELVNSARGICSNEEDDPIKEYLEPIMEDLARAYLHIVEKQVGKRKEFFGLRDFYSLIKMLYWLTKNNAKDSPGCDEEMHYVLSRKQLKHAILRNFGGSDEIDPLEEFAACFTSETFNVVDEMDASIEPDCSRMGLISASLNSKDRSWHGENRYLLFLTENDAALQILNRYLFQTSTLAHLPHILFGSSFPKDKDYTQICRNINQIKICMETGRPVVLLNLENLYESLYDLLNQYYTEVQDKRYVDLGLQTHRIKCRVHDDFKLILIAEKDKVYDKFPIPLINRLEKHLVMTSTILNQRQLELCKQLKRWIQAFTQIHNFKEGDAFIGYQPETPAAVVLQASQQVGLPPDNGSHDDIEEEQWRDDVLACCQGLLIQMACPDALARLKGTALRDKVEEIWTTYFQEQHHLSLSKMLKQHDFNQDDAMEDSSSGKPGLLSFESQESFEQSMEDPTVSTDGMDMGLLVQVTTHSQPLAPVDVSRLCRELKIDKKTLIHMYLEELDAEADFTDRIKKHFESVSKGDAYVLVQCSSGHLNKDLISCARHKAIDELQNFRETTKWQTEYVPQHRKVHVVFIVSLPKTPGGSKFIAFQGGKWLCVHLDDLRSSADSELGFLSAMRSSLSQLVYPGHGSLALHKRLRTCIQGAVAQIPEGLDQSSSRKFELLNTLLDVIPEDGSANRDENTFYSVLVKRICSLIEQNEKLQTDGTGQEWAVREALNRHRLQEGGTFLNTLLKRIDLTLTDLLSYIVEFVNQHDNLGLYQDENLKDMWLRMFDNEHICQLKYEHMKQSDSSTRHNLIQRLGTLSTKGYSCKVPFSWLILSGVEAKWKIFEDTENDTAEVTKAFCDHVQASYLGKFLESTDEALLPQLAELYLDDFIAGVLQSVNPNESKVLKKYLQILSEDVLGSCGGRTVLLQFLSFHVVYHLHELQFIQYRELGRIFDELHQIVLEKLSEEVQEPLDLTAVSLLLERITPKPITDKEFWKVQNLRDVYVRKLCECLNIVNGILSTPTPNSTILVSVRQTWQKIRAVEMYISHLILPLPDDPEVNKGAFRLWHALSRSKRVLGFSSKEALDQCLKILKSVDDCVAKSFGQSATESRRLAVSMSKSKTECSDERQVMYLKYCNAVKMFFLEMVSVLCFGPGSYEPPGRDLIEALMKRVLGENHTKDLTPLEWEEEDTAPVIRSVLLQLLLLGREEDVTGIGELIESFMAESSQCLTCNKDSENISVCALVVHCLEDKMYKTFPESFASSNTVKLIEKLSHQLEYSITTYSSHTQGSPVTFKWLHSVAQIRVCLHFVADLLVTHCVNDSSDNLSHRGQMMLKQMLQFLSDALQREELQNLTLYLMKQIARRYGMKNLTDLYDRGYKFVLPTRFQYDEGDRNVQDLFVLCGQKYLKLRSSIVQSSVDGSVESLKSAVQATPSRAIHCVTLALFSIITWPFQSKKCGFTEEMLQETAQLKSLGLMNENLLTVYSSVLEGNIGGRSTVMQPSDSIGDRPLAALVLHTVTVLLNQRNALLEPFVNILIRPSLIKGTYLPAMPEDPLTVAEEVMAFDRSKGYRADYGKLYQCPNGHPYLIADCTNPNASATCNVCKAPIGAATKGSSRLAEGNSLAQSDSRNEIGHVLGDATTRAQDAFPERSLSPLACAVTRFILHACYLWSSCHSSEDNVKDLRSTINVPVEDLGQFFWNHLRADLEIIGRTLSRGEDEVAMLLHQVVNTISQLDVTDVDSSLATKNIRRNWEDQFVSKALTPLMNIDGTVQGSIEEIAKESEAAEDGIFMAVHEKTGKEAPDLTDTLWMYRSRITLQDLAAALRNTSNPKENYPLLDYFVSEESVFRALQYLPDVVRLQKILINCYSHRSDRNDVMHPSIGAALKKITNSEEERNTLLIYLQSTRKAWKLVRNQLINFPHHKVTNEDIQVIGDMSEDVSLAYFLPRLTGPGVCALALSDYLCRRHNWLLDFCLHKKFTGFHRNTVQLTQLQSFHVISYEREIDSMLLTHCRYSLRFGRGQEVEWDFAALEKHIYDRFIMGKPVINRNSQPMMVFTSDVIRQDVFKKLEEKIKPQISLTSEERKEVISRLCHDMTEVSSALQTVTIAMGFLAGETSQPDMPLGQYVLRVLKIKRKLEFCRKYTLRHVLSLWETLALEKSRKHSLNGKEVPFDGLDHVIVFGLEPLDSKLKDELKAVLKTFNLDLLMSLLFKFIQIWLPTIEPAPLNKPLTEYLDPYIDELDDNNIRDLQPRLASLPGDMLVKNVVDVWNTTVRFQDDFEQEGMM